MPLVERILILKNGPPWGFRLQDNGFGGGLKISKVRKQSPADEAGLKSNDEVLGFNGVSSENMSHVEAMNIIDMSVGVLSIKVGRQEVRQMQTIFFEKPAASVIEDAISAMPKWEPEPQEPSIQPSDPEVAAVPFSKLMMEYELPPTDPSIRRRTYGDSSFWHEPGKYYPTKEEQIEMARSMAESLTHVANAGSKGSALFLKRRHRADKCIIEGPDPIDEPDNWALIDPDHPPPPPPLPPPKPPGYPGMIPDKRRGIPPPPPLPPGAPRTTAEFLEKIKTYPRNEHTDVEPEKCFDIAKALYNSNSLGAKIFNKRRAKSHKWTIEGPEPLHVEPGSENEPPSKVQSRPKYPASKLVPARHSTVSMQSSSGMASSSHYPSASQQRISLTRTESPSFESTFDLRKSSFASSVGTGTLTTLAMQQGWNPTPQPQPFSTNTSNVLLSRDTSRDGTPVGGLTPAFSSSSIGPSSVSKSKEWRPVKFTIGSKSGPLPPMAPKSSSQPVSVLQSSNQDDNGSVDDAAASVEIELEE